MRPEAAARTRQQRFLAAGGVGHWSHQLRQTPLNGSRDIAV